MTTCSASPSGQLLKAIGEFNRGDWFECHETLEDLWIGAQGEMRDFYQGILQVAVALHHWRNGNYQGAVRLLEGGAGYLGRVSETCQRIDVSELMAAAWKVRQALIDLGPHRMAELPAGLVPMLHLVRESGQESPIE